MHPMRLYCPVGAEELRFAFEANMRAFPPRLPHQPTFYPVTDVDHARQVAVDRMTKQRAQDGFVTRFDIEETYGTKFERYPAGARGHYELWVPADELAEFNDHLLGPIEVIAAYFSAGYQGSVAEGPVLAGLSARGQLLELALGLRHLNLGPLLEDPSNRAAIFLNFFFWERTQFDEDDVDAKTRDRVLAALRTAWAERREPTHLGGAAGPP